MERLKSDQKIAEIIVCSQVFIAFFAMIIIALLLITTLLPKCCNISSNAKYGLKCVPPWLSLRNFFYSEDKKTLIISSVVLSTFINSYLLALDSVAVHDRNSTDTDLSTLYNSSILTWLPVIVLVLDLSSCIIFASLITCVLCVNVCCPTCKEKKTALSYCCLSASLVCTIFSILMHFPYISIAFLNDAYHAGSIFIYYSIVIFVSFVIIEIVYKSVVTKCDLTCGSVSHWECPTKYGIFLLVSFILLEIFLGLIVTVTCYFVIIPINKSISDAPNRLVGIYQSAVVVLAAVVFYRAFLRKKRKPIEKAIKKCDDFPVIKKEEWKKLSEEEKQDYFYGQVVAIVGNFETGESPLTVTSRGPVNGTHEVDSRDETSDLLTEPQEQMLESSSVNNSVTRNGMQKDLKDEPSQ